MSAIKAKDTKAELALRRALSSLGLRYRLHRAGLPGRPDIVFVSRKLVVFCDGDFWHGRNWVKKQKTRPIKTRSKYWLNKIQTNMTRDKRNNRDLRKAGWKVLRLWETDILSDPEKAAAKVYKVLKQLA